MKMEPIRRKLMSHLYAEPPILTCAGSVSQELSIETGLKPTPACDDDFHLLPSQAESLYFQSNSPERIDLLGEDADSHQIMLLGYVFDRRCRPVPDAKVEIWHADETGKYDLIGDRWRGHQFTDQSGRWGFRTVITQHYSFRTAHYHFHVQRPGGKVLRTQLYFPTHPKNSEDRLFDTRLVLSMLNDGAVGRFDFVTD